MSGGSWNYAYNDLERLAEKLCNERKLKRRVLGKLVWRLAQAMHDIEWVDSDDMSPGDEIKAIEEVLLFDPARVGVEILHENLDCIIDDAREWKNLLPEQTISQEKE